MNNPVFVHQQSIGSLSSRGFFSLSSQHSQKGKFTMNNPMLVHQQSIGSLCSRGFFSLSSQQVVLDTVKKVSLL